MGLSANSAYFKLLNVQESIISQRLYFVLACALIIGIPLTLYFSHKAVGPIYRLKTYLDDLKNGPFYPLKFRDGDYFSELPEKLNSILDKKD